MYPALLRARRTLPVSTPCHRTCKPRRLKLLYCASSYQRRVWRRLHYVQSINNRSWHLERQARQSSSPCLQCRNQYNAIRYMVMNLPRALFQSLQHHARGARGNGRLRNQVTHGRCHIIHYIPLPFSRAAMKRLTFFVLPSLSSTIGLSMSSCVGLKPSFC
jgi:hypothetical protein